MALVRCTCIAELTLAGRHSTFTVALPDPDCGYVLHRLAAELPSDTPGIEPETHRG